MTNRLTKFIELISLIIIILLLILLITQKVSNDISDANLLWTLYDKNISAIEDSMDEITESNENFEWWILKDFDIDDDEYELLLNRLTADIRTCYIILTDDNDIYTNSNPIRKYRNKTEISSDELSDLNFQNDLRNCVNYFRYDSLIISEDTAKREKFLKETGKIAEAYNKITCQDECSYQDLLTREIFVTAALKDLSYWLKGEYYSYKN